MIRKIVWLGDFIHRSRLGRMAYSQAIRAIPFPSFQMSRQYIILTLHNTESSHHHFLFLEHFQKIIPCPLTHSFTFLLCPDVGNHKSIFYLLDYPILNILDYSNFEITFEIGTCQLSFAFLEDHLGYSESFAFPHKFQNQFTNF